jgi:hypothetical protein
MFDDASVQSRHLRVIPGKTIGVLLRKAIIGSRRDRSNFLLTNVGRGLSPGPMSTSSSSSADVSPYPSFPSSIKSLQIDEERDRKSFGRSFRSAALSYSLTLETLQLMYGRLLEWAPL